MSLDFQDTLEPYSTVERDYIQYTYCRDFNHISRYKNLRQVVHEGSTSDRYVALETANPFKTNADVTYYTVPTNRENRLDLIAKDTLGSATYSWVIAYFNDILDGYTVLEGTRLAIPKSVSSLFNNGEVLESIPATTLNLGKE